MGFVKKVFKGIKKIVKKVVKVVKKAAPLLVMAAAVYFTAGAALGVAGTSWGGLVSAGVSKLGLSGVAGSMLTAAGTYAGYGAVAGVGTALVTGQDPWKGLTKGALMGAAAGAAVGGIGAMGSAAGGASQAGTMAQYGMGAVPAGGASPVASTASAALPQGAAAGGGTWSGAIKNAIKTPEFLGHAVSGVGKAISGISQAGAERDAAEAERRRQEEISKSYSGLDTRTPLPAPPTVPARHSQVSQNLSRQSAGLSERMGSGTAHEQPRSQGVTPPARPVAGGGAQPRRDDEELV